MSLTVTLYISLVVGLTASPALPDITTNCTTVISESPAEIVLALDTPDAELSVVTVAGEEFVKVGLIGESRLGRTGLPDLPAVNRTVIVPFNVNVTLETIRDERTLIASPLPPRPFTENIEEPTSPSLTQVESLFPSEAVVLGETRYFRGRRLIDITFHPYQYDPDASDLIRHEEVEVALKFTPIESGEDGYTEPPRQVALTRDTYRFLNALTLNSPRRDDNGAALPRGGYLIVAGNGFGNAEEAINELADWKRACGHHVEVEMGETRGSTILRDFVRPAYEEWDPPLEQVCLIGTWNNPGTPSGQWGDIYYGLLEGRNDHISEVAVCRLGASSATQAETAIGRVLSYQSDPYTEETDWLNSAGACEYNVDETTDAVEYTVRWIAEAERRAGFENTRLYIYDGNNEDRDGDPGRWIRDGVNIFFVRGSYAAAGCPINEFYPMVFTIGGGHVEGNLNSMWNVGSPDRLQGPSAASCSGHRQSTVTCNVLLGALARGLLVDKLPLGWARAFAMSMLDYAGVSPEGFDYYLSEFMLYGEPGQVVWCGEPREIDVTHPREISPGTNRLDIIVDDPEMEAGVPNALVTLMQPGELLCWRLTDQDGRCTMPFDPELEGEVRLTVTGDDIFPYAVDIEIDEQPVFLGVDEIQIDDEVSGNGDGIMNPGETVSLSISVRNFGNSHTVQNVIGIVRSSCSWVSIEEHALDFGDIERESSADADGPVEISLDTSTPNDADLGLYIELRSGNDRWRSNLDVDPVGPQLELVEIVGGEVIQTGLSNLTLDLINIGELESQETTARLISVDWVVNVIDNETIYDPIEAGGEDTVSARHFRINISSMTVRGTIIPMQLLLFAQEGDCPDTIFFELQAEEPAEDGPVGPDDYGYTCFDNTDDDWVQAPVYGWIEICPDEDWDYRGQELEGNRPANFAIEMELPFNFRYYGEEFDLVTIAENGFIAMGGDIEDLGQYDNFPLDRCFNGSFGMIAPFWDDLMIGNHNERNIYTFYARDEGIFIIEWYNPSGADFHFQVILFDPEVHPTVTRDGEILFQYRGEPRIRADQPPRYCSIGICSPDGRTGISYFAGNEYHPAAAPLVDHRAILFSTALRFQPGKLYGYVTDVETEQPIEDAVVFTGHGFATTTDEEGFWEIETAPGNLLFNITAAKHGYNDSTLVDTIVAIYDSIRIDLALLHPEIQPSTWHLSNIMDPDLIVNLPFNIRNDGNGPLDWSLRREMPDNAHVDPWHLRRNYPVGQTANDSRIEGLVFIDSLFYVAGANWNGQVDEPNVIYILNHDGELVDTLLQPEAVDGTYGMHDLAWDGELIWGTGGTHIVGMNLEGDAVTVFDGPHQSNRALAWDPDRQVLWVAGITTNIVAVNRRGETVATLDRKGFRNYGLGYWFDDPDGYPLYIFHNPQDMRMHVHKMNPENGDTMFVANLSIHAEGTAGGIYITNQYDVYSWVFMNIANNGADDRIDVWQLEARREWFRLFTNIGQNRVEVDEGRIDAEESRNFELQLSSIDLPVALFEGTLHFDHNAEVEETVLQVTLDVIGPIPPTEFGLLQPEDGTEINLNADTTLLDFAWEQSIDYNRGEEVYYTVWFESGEQSASVTVETNTITLDLCDIADSLGLPIDAAFSVTWQVQAISGDDTVDCEQPFSLSINPNSIIDTNNEIPVEFGLHSVYPSPFNACTTIRFGIDKPGAVILKLFDLTGREVSILLDRPVSTGYHKVVLDAADLPSGIYLLRLESTDRSSIAKTALIR